MMLLTSADAIFRYFFHQAIIGAYEFTEKYLMVIVVFLGMSYVMRTKGHIRIDIIVERLPEHVVSWFQGLFYLFGAGLMFAIGYQSMMATHEAFVKGYTSAGLIAWPTWLSIIWVPIGAYVFSIRLLLESVTAVMDSFSKRER